MYVGATETLDSRLSKHSTDYIGNFYYWDGSRRLKNSEQRLLDYAKIKVGKGLLYNDQMKSNISSKIEHGSVYVITGLKKEDVYSLIFLCGLFCESASDEE